jgi:hypothetical protein
MTAHMQRVHPKVFKSRANIRTPPRQIGTTNPVVKPSQNCAGIAREARAGGDSNTRPPWLFASAEPRGNVRATYTLRPGDRRRVNSYAAAPPIIVLENISFQTPGFWVFTRCVYSNLQRAFGEGFLTPHSAGGTADEWRQDSPRQDCLR